MTEQPKWVNIKTFCEITGNQIKPTHVEEMARQKRIRSVKVGRIWLIRADAFELLDDEQNGGEA